MVEESRLPPEPQPNPQVVSNHGEEEIRYPDGRIERPSIRFETKDVNFKVILRLIIGAMIFAAIVHYIILVFFYEYNRYESKNKRSDFPRANTPAYNLSQDGMPKEPRLEQLERMGAPLELTPKQRKEALREQRKANTYLRQKDREETLHGYGPSDPQEKGFVHIPIRDAMKYAVEHKKLPSRTVEEEEHPRDRGLVDAGESNSGRMFRRKALWSER
jgi:hypothetical protein